MSFIFIFSGCLANTQTFKTGELLKTGQSKSTWAMGSLVPIYTYHEADTSTQAKIPAHFSKSQSVPLSYQFRLGAWEEEWLVFKGLEVGYTLEIPHTMEFDLTMGLKNPFGRHDSSFHHSVAIGWELGSFPDNSYFLEYAFSKKVNRTIKFYSNWREIWHATPIGDTRIESDNNSKDFFEHNRSWVHQFAVGSEIQLPPIFIIPDQFTFQYFIQAPTIPIQGSLHSGTPISFTGFNLGMSWIW